MTSEAFTKEDVGDPGRIKRETTSQFRQRLQSANPQIWDAFLNVCDEMGMDPGQVLANEFVRALNNEDHMNRVFNQPIDMSILQTDDIRREDAEMIQDLAESLGIGSDDDGEKDSVDKLIERRIEASGKSPMESFSLKDEEGGGNDEDIRRLEEKLDRTIDALEEDSNEVTQTDVSSGGEVNADELFDDDEDQSGSDDSDEVDELFEEDVDNDSDMDGLFDDEEEGGEDVGDNEVEEDEEDDVEVVVDTQQKEYPIDPDEMEDGEGGEEE